MRLQDNYYLRFDEIPAYNFQAFLDEGDPSFLMKSEVEKPKLEDVQKVWNGIFQEYLDFMGLSNRQRMIMEKEDYIVKLCYRIYVEGKRHYKAILKQAEEELEKMTERINNKKNALEAAAMSKYLTFHVPTKQVSAKEYYSYIKLITSDG